MLCRYLNAGSCCEKFSHALFEISCFSFDLPVLSSSWRYVMCQISLELSLGEKKNLKSFQGEISRKSDFFWWYMGKWWEIGRLLCGANYLLIIETYKDCVIRNWHNWTCFSLWVCLGFVCTHPPLLLILLVLVSWILCYLVSLLCSCNNAYWYFSPVCLCL